MKAYVNKKTLSTTALSAALVAASFGTASASPTLGSHSTVSLSVIKINDLSTMRETASTAALRTAAVEDHDHVHAARKISSISLHEKFDV